MIITGLDSGTMMRWKIQTHKKGRRHYRRDRRQEVERPQSDPAANLLVEQHRQPQRADDTDWHEDDSVIKRILDRFPEEPVFEHVFVVAKASKTWLGNDIVVGEAEVARRDHGTDRKDQKTENPRRNIEESLQGFPLTQRQGGAETQASPNELDHATTRAGLCANRHVSKAGVKTKDDLHTCEHKLTEGGFVDRQPGHGLQFHRRWSARYSGSAAAWGMMFFELPKYID